MYVPPQQLFANQGVEVHLFHATLYPKRPLNLFENDLITSTFSSTSTLDARSLDHDGVFRHVEAQMLKHRHAALSVLYRAAVG